jgi:predicted nucleic acid-binding protein
MQVLVEFYSVATSKLRMNAGAVMEIIENWNGWMMIHRPEPADIARSARLQRRYQISWFDSLIINSALQLGCSTLWTEDLNHGQKYESVTVRNPFK